jgi:hypothetical protein
MAERKQAGDGPDNYGQAARQITNAAKQTGKSAVKRTAAKGAEAAGRAAAATVKAGAETGKAVAKIAAGTAAGGPWGAAVSAAWSMRHTLLKILVCVCMVIVFIAAIAASLPSIVFDRLFELSGGSAAGNALAAAYADLADGVSGAVNGGYAFALEKADRIIIEGGYDYDLSVAALEDRAAGAAYYDVCYILSAYSVSTRRGDSGKTQMVYKLESVKGDMFPVTYEEKAAERPKGGAPETETVIYVACVIHEFDEGAVIKAFGIDLGAAYGFNLTYGEAIERMSDALKMTLYGAAGENIKAGEGNGQ